MKTLALFFILTVLTASAAQASAPLWSEAKLNTDAAEMLTKLSEYFNGAHPRGLSPQEEAEYIHSEAEMFVAGLRNKSELINIASSKKEKHHLQSILAHAAADLHSKGIPLAQINQQRPKVEALKSAFNHGDNSTLRRTNLARAVTALLRVSNNIKSNRY